MNISSRKFSEPARKKTLAEGRRIPKDKSVEDPKLVEIMETLASSGLNALPEYKQYSRERSREMSLRGRVRVQLKNDDGTLCNPDFPSRESVMLYISSNIPKLKSRTSKPQENVKEASKKKGKNRK